MDELTAAIITEDPIGETAVEIEEYHYFCNHHFLEVAKRSDFSLREVPDRENPIEQGRERADGDLVLYLKDEEDSYYQIDADLEQDLRECR